MHQLVSEALNLHFEIIEKKKEVLTSTFWFGSNVLPLTYMLYCGIENRDAPLHFAFLRVVAYEA